MEGELWEVLYRITTDEGSRRPPGRAGAARRRAAIVLVLLWAALHDRPVCRACRAYAGPGCPSAQRPATLPSAATMSRRLRTVGTLQLLEQVLGRLAASAMPARWRGGWTASRCRSAAAAATATCGGGAPGRGPQGPRVQAVFGLGWRRRARRLDARGDERRRAAGRRPANWSRNSPARAGGYLLGDGLYDSNPLHCGAGAAGGLQLVALWS